MFADQQALAAHDKDVHQKRNHPSIGLNRPGDGTSIQSSLLGQDNTKTVGLSFKKVGGKTVVADHSDHPNHLVSTSLF